MELAALPGNSVRGWHVVFGHTSGLINHTNSKIGVIWSLASTGIAAGDRQRTRHPIVEGFTFYGARWKNDVSELLRSMASFFASGFTQQSSSGTRSEFMRRQLFL